MRYMTTNPHLCDNPPDWDVEPEPTCEECGAVLQVDVDEEDFGVTTTTYCEVCDE